MSAEQLNEFVGTLLSGVKALSTREGGPAAPSAPAPEPPKLEIDKAMFDPTSDKFDPVGAVAAISAHQNKSLLGDVNRRSVQAMYGNFRQQIPDFGQFEGKITEALSKRDPLSLTEADVFGTYLTMKGMKSFQEEQAQRGRASGTTTMPPSPPADLKTTPELSADEKEIAQRLFPNEADPIAKYQQVRQRIESGYTVKVPLGDGKTA